MSSGDQVFGLENFGNTCYCNSVVQALYHTEPFRNYILGLDPVSRPPRRVTPGAVPHPSLSTSTTAGSGGSTASSATSASQDTPSHPGARAMPTMRAPDAAGSLPAGQRSGFSALRSKFSKNNATESPLSSGPGIAGAQSLPVGSIGGNGDLPMAGSAGSTSTAGFGPASYGSMTGTLSNNGGLSNGSGLSSSPPGPASSGNPLSRPANPTPVVGFLDDNDPSNLRISASRQNSVALSLNGDTGLDAMSSSVGSNSNFFGSGSAPSNGSSTNVAGGTGTGSSSNSAGGNTSVTAPLGTPQSQDTENLIDQRKRNALQKGPIVNLDESFSEAYGRSESLVTALKDLFESIAEHESLTGVASPSRLVKVLKNENDLFRSSMHQDAQEFLNFLLNRVIEEDSTGRNLSSNAKGGKGSVDAFSEGARGLFAGELTNEMRCLSCETTTRRNEPFYDFSLETLPDSSVYSCLQRFSASEMLGGANKFYCDVCGGQQEALKRMKVRKAPPILVLHLKRFKFSEAEQRNTKLLHRVLYSRYLRLPVTTDDCPTPEKLYELSSVIVHLGGGPYQGHYVVVTRTPHGWLLFDDEIVDLVDESFVYRFFGEKGSLSTAYLLLYQEVDEHKHEADNIPPQSRQPQPQQQPFNVESAPESTDSQPQGSPPLASMQPQTQPQVPPQSQPQSQNQSQSQNLFQPQNPFHSQNPFKAASPPQNSQQGNNPLQGNNPFQSGVPLQDKMRAQSVPQEAAPQFRPQFLQSETVSDAEAPPAEPEEGRTRRMSRMFSLRRPSHNT